MTSSRDIALRSVARANAVVAAFVADAGSEVEETVEAARVDGSVPVRRRHLGVAVRWASLLCMACLGLLPAGCSSGTSESGDAVKIGLLLPFTGPDAATSSNFERAVIYAVGRVNAGGGIGGRKLEVVSRDTHSDRTRSLQSAHELIDEGVTVVLGPENPEIAAELLPLFREAEISLVSPLVGAAEESAVDCSHPWFRLAPSAKALGEALAKQMRSHQVERAALLEGEGAYNRAIANSVAARFQSLGGLVVERGTLTDGAQSYVDVLAPVAASHADAVVLAASPLSGALLINESSVLGRNATQWYLSPLLKTDLFLQNVDPSRVEGALGVAPKIYEQKGAFPADFAHRWQGDQPLEGAYFYYDAVALVGLALQRTSLANSGTFDYENVEASILAVAGAEGESKGWDELEDALARQRDGARVHYSGLTGPLLLGRCGDRRLGVTTVWSVAEGRVVEETK